MKIKYGCGIIVLDKENKILLGQRAKAKTESDHMQYCIPGGGIEFGELPNVAAARELEEEVNLHANISNITLLCRTSLIDSIKNVEKVDYTYIHFMEDEVPVAKEDEMLNLKFFTLKEIIELALESKLYPATLVSISNYINLMAK